MPEIPDTAVPPDERIRACIVRGQSRLRRPLMPDACDCDFILQVVPDGTGARISFLRARCWRAMPWSVRQRRAQGLLIGRVPG